MIARSMSLQRSSFQVRASGFAYLTFEYLFIPRPAVVAAAVKIHDICVIYELFPNEKQVNSRKPAVEQGSCRRLDQTQVLVHTSLCQRQRPCHRR